MTFTNRIIFSKSSGDSVAQRALFGAFWSLIGAVASRGITLLSTILAARMLGTAGFGELGVLQNTQGLFGVLAGTGLGLAATKFVAEQCCVDSQRANRFAVLTMLTSILVGLLCSIVMILCASLIAKDVLSAPHLISEMRVSSGLILFSSVNIVQTGVLAGLGDFRAIAGINILRGVVLFISLLFGIWIAGLLGGIYALIGTEICTVVASQVVLERKFPLQWINAWFYKSIWKDAVALCHFSGLSISASVVTTFAFWIVNVWLVREENGFSAMGVFNAADRWRQLLLFLPATFSQLFLSMLSNLNGRGEYHPFQKILKISVFANVAAVLLPTIVFLLFSSHAMRLFGEEYDQGAKTLAILAGSTVPVVLNNILGQVLVSKGKMLLRFLMDIVLSIVLLVSAWCLIPLWQDQGLALAYLAAYGVVALALIPLAHQYSRIQGD